MNSTNLSKNTKAMSNNHTKKNLDNNSKTKNLTTYLPTVFLHRDAPSMIEESDIDEVVVTNSVPHDTQKSKTSKIKTVDISILLAEAIRRIHNKESMSHLFRNVTMED